MCAENNNAPADRGVVQQNKLTVCEVHGDFKADTQVGVGRFGPHRLAPFGGWVGATHFSAHLRREMFS
ncbi:protein of unknown function [Candidatus Nitrotoga arctica]|uniref:Uncharacterized protein n=1 Tax=Candidatus Nitrotoga arctica TaxID=453162 RepID=A0ABM8Z093_9PROT|nr:protein of unknown function [Candidatus Nitrotoga arctica]